MTDTRRRTSPGLRRGAAALTTALMIAAGLLSFPAAAQAAVVVSGACEADGVRSIDLGEVPDDVTIAVRWETAHTTSPFQRRVIGEGQSVVVPGDLANDPAAPFEVYPVLVTTAKNPAPGEEPVESTPDGSRCVVQLAPGNTNLSLPVLSGPVRVGAHLTATTGEWAETDGWEFTYRWEGAKANPIRSPELTIDASMRGKNIVLKVLAKRPGHLTTEAVVQLPPVAVGEAITNVLPPSISGTAQVGSTMVPKRGDWKGGYGLSYQCAWFRDSVKVSSSCDPITLKPSNLGQSFTVRVTAESVGYRSSEPVMSAPVVVTAGKGAVVTRQPGIEGTTTVGQIITLDRGDWQLPPDASFTFRWLRNGMPVAQKTSAAYLLGPDDGGARITAEVSAVAPGYQTTTITTSPTAPVTKGPRPVATANPKISGTATVANTLTATSGTWSKPGLQFKYTWLRDGVVVPEASGSTYKLAGVDAGTTISVRVTATSTGWNTNTATSAGTAKIAKGAAPTALTTPKILGTAKVGTRLTVSTGTWSKPSLTFSYQWMSDGTAIPGATSSAYTLKAAQKGKVITVKVVASRTGYNAGAAITAGTARVN